jgi:hypothetical protein
MGIAVVLIVYFVVLSVAAAICCAILVATTRWYLRDAPRERRKLMAYAGVLPFVCVAYAGVCFIAYAVINDTVFHRDPMLGDGWSTPIGHGYAIDMIDVTDQGTVHPVDGPDGGLNSPERVSGVRRMQVAGPFILGTEDRNWFANLGKDVKDESNFFVIDTRTRARREFASESELAAYASQNGASLALKPIADVYDQYRFTWFDALAGVALLLLPMLAFCWLVWLVARAKRKELKLAEEQS